MTSQRLSINLERVFHEKEETIAQNRVQSQSLFSCHQGGAEHGFYALTKSVLEQDPLSFHLFLFVNRKRDYAKIFYFGSDALCLWAKRLEQGHFAKLGAEHEVASLSDTQLMMWFDGIGLEQRQQLKHHNV